MAHYQLVACTFEGPDAETTAATLARDIAEHFPHLHEHNVARLFRAEDGELRIHETAEARESVRGQAAGTVAGWLLGFANAVLGGPLGPAQAAPIGGAVGMEAGVEHDAGFSNTFLHSLGETLDKGDAALLAVAREDEATQIVELLRARGGQASVRELTPKVLGHSG